MVRAKGEGGGEGQGSGWDCELTLLAHENSEVALPWRPIRPVRPMRCTYELMSRGSS